MLSVGDWTRRGNAGEWAHVQYSLIKSQNPVAGVTVLLDGVATEPELTGSDLRREYGRYFKLPVEPGDYLLTVFARDACGHETGVARPMTVTVR